MIDPNIVIFNQQLKDMSTSVFYTDNAKVYFDETLVNDVNHVCDRFLSTLQKPLQSANAGKPHILDLGCGAGRDSKVFIDAGFTVTALEASKELALLAEEHIGQPVLNMRYQQLQVKNTYDGIWACASLLHCPKSQIEYVMQNCIDALKEGGVFYFSFKHGEGERLDDWGRFFNDYTLESLNTLIAKLNENELDELEIVELWQETELLRGKDQTWINGLVRKVKQ
jgi:SAM-dependent methyltransferase